MPDESELQKEAANRLKPKSLKRVAPAEKDLTAAEAAEQEERWGVPVIYRVKPDTRTAMDRAAEAHNVGKSALADFLLRAGLVMLDKGMIDLESQREEEEPSKRLTLPDVPMAYRE